MNKFSARFLQAVVVVIGVVVLTALLWEPHLEGVNANATSLREIYFDDPFLAYIYFSFIAVFIGMYQTWKLLGQMGRGAVSEQTVKALKTIKYCAATFSVLILGAVKYIVVTMSGKDDIAGAVAVGLFLACASAVTATVAWMFEKKLRNRA